MFAPPTATSDLYALLSAAVPSLNSATPCSSSVFDCAALPFRTAPTALAKSPAPAVLCVHAVPRAVANGPRRGDGGVPAFLIEEPQTTNVLRMIVSRLLFAVP